MTVKRVADVQGVGCALIDYSAAPGITGPPLHVHNGIDEAWYLLEGGLTVQVGEEHRRVSAGSFLLVPHGVPHTFVNAGDERARWVGVLSPGSALGMLEELGRLIPEHGTPDEDAIVNMFRATTRGVLGPPLS